MTTADVVDSPTPLAPPSVVMPHEQLTPEMIAPKTVDLINNANRSDFCKALEAESRMTFGLTSYTKSSNENERERERGEICYEVSFLFVCDSVCVKEGESENLPARSTDADIPIAKHSIESRGKAIAQEMTRGVTR